MSLIPFRRFGGWAVYVVDGRLTFSYNVLGIHKFPAAADSEIPAGTHQVRMELSYDGGGLAKGGDGGLHRADVGSGVTPPARDPGGAPKR